MYDNQEELKIQAILKNLELTYEERILAHEQARVLVEELSQAGNDLRARSEEAS